MATNAKVSRAVRELNVESIARGYTRLALSTLAGIMKGPKYPPSARVAAANSILDRAWGKPSQSVAVDGEIQVTIRKMLEEDDPNPLILLDITPNEGSSPAVEPSGPQGPSSDTLEPCPNPLISLDKPEP